MKTAKIFLFLNFLFFFSVISSAQTEADSSMVIIETQDGNRFTGKIINQDSEKIVLLTENLGEIAVQKKNIKTQALIHASRMKNGEWWFDNPQSSRYFWAPNGYGLKKGEGYYQNIWVLWNQFAYGITNNFSIGGTIIPAFLFGGAPTPVFISPKFSIPVDKDKFNLGAGALIGTILGEDNTTFGLVYGVSTFGSPDGNISFGLGYGFGGGEWSSSPLINISGMKRLSSRWYFLSENYIMGIDGETGGVISGGARWIIKKAALDFGLFIPIGTDDVLLVLPWLGFTIPFGNVN